ncbi:HrpB1 family type III secretion system apparatus protein [Bradyrhizobium sp. U531]|uniref:HrpB1 family type III secretion system apparatus protein n=1 Tax=Bradyrhizobium sp. U531 TaxID=3053458 RepID=UPI003F422984
MIELTADDVRTLAELGFMALSRGQGAQAAAIFAGVRAARPAEEAGFIGAALVDMAAGNYAGAVKTMRALPPTDTQQAFLALALYRSGDRAAAREISREVMQTAGDRADAALARELLVELDGVNEPMLR